MLFSDKYGLEEKENDGKLSTGDGKRHFRDERRKRSCR